MKTFHKARFAKMILLVMSSAFLVSCDKNDDQGSIDSSTGQPAITGKLKLLIIGDENVGAVIKRQWEARTEATIQHKTVDLAAFQKSQSLVNQHDVILFPANQLGAMISADLIQPLSENLKRSPQFDQRAVFALERNAVVRWGEDLWGVSMGNPRLVLIYNNTKLAQLQLTPPTERTQFLAMPDFIKDSGERGNFAILEPSAGHWASYSLLTRSANYVVAPGHYSTLFDLTSAKSKIASPPFVKALEGMVACWKTRGEMTEHLSPTQVLETLARGEALAGLTWPHADGGNVKYDESVFDSLVISSLPHSKDWYEPFSQAWTQRDKGLVNTGPLVGHTGYIAAITNKTKSIGIANQFLIWLGSKEICQLISPHFRESGLTRPNQVALTHLWMGKRWNVEAQEAYGQVVKKENEQTAWLSSLRIPGRDEYLNILDEAVRSALEGNQSPELALQEAAKRWDQLTEKRGTRKLIRSLRNDLGLDN